MQHGDLDSVALKSKTITATTTSNGLFACNLSTSEGMVLGVYVQGYRCVPIVGLQGTHMGWNAMLIRTDTSTDVTLASNVTVTATVYYIAS